MARNVINKRIELNSEDVDWFESHYPNGSLTGVISMLFTKFREANTMTPAEYADLAAKELSNEIYEKARS